MDKGIKIAILVACVLSLGFGLIWDKVIDGARATFVNKPDAADMGPSKAEIRVGDLSKPSLIAPERVEPVVAAPVATQPQPASGSATVVSPTSTAGGKHEVKDGESLGTIVQKVGSEKQRALPHRERMALWMAANPGVIWEKLRPGTKLNIPS